MDDARLFRFAPGYRTIPLQPALDWSEYEVDDAARGMGYAKAVEMCNNNGHCRKFDAGTMCPSYRATRDETHLTRGRANTLRLALSGQLAFDDAKKALELCVSCKGCKRECPTGVDMARMKIEYLAQYRRSHGPTLRDRAIAYLPRYAPLAARVAPLANLGSALLAPVLGFAAERSLPRWRRDAFHGPADAQADVVLFVDTFTRYFEPENARAAVRVLGAAGYRVHVPQPLCCGRTFLSVGLVDEAKREARRLRAALQPFVARGVPIVGLEPSCLFTLRDEFSAMLPGAETTALAQSALLIEEFLAREADAGRLNLPLKALAVQALLHGHCHQKAFGAMGAVERVLRMVPELSLRVVESSCCGMAGSFGHEAEHLEISMKMAEASLLPAVRSAPVEALVVADGTSCRQQIAHGAGREALHVVRVLERALQ